MPLKELGIMCEKILKACEEFKECDLGAEYNVPLEALVEHLEDYPEYELEKIEGDCFDKINAYANQMKNGITREELIRDGIAFFNLIGFIEVCTEYDLECGPAQESIDAYNETVIKIDELANKYGLHNKEMFNKSCWYEHMYLWPKMKKFFTEHIVCD